MISRSSTIRAPTLGCSVVMPVCLSRVDANLRPRRFAVRNISQREPRRAAVLHDGPALIRATRQPRTDECICEGFRLQFLNPPMLFRLAAQYRFPFVAAHTV